MGRYRAPQRQGSAYITPEGAARLRAEFNHLWRVLRPEVTAAVAAAAAMGDRSENAEYIYGKRQLREIDRRVRFLMKRLEQLKVVDTVPDDTTRVYFGAWVSVEDEHGVEQRYRIVGPDEFDAAAEYISMDAPLARALLGRRIDDEVRVERPAGVTTLLITDVRYTPPEHAGAL